MEEVKAARLKSDWIKFQDSEFWGEYTRLLTIEHKRIYEALTSLSNDRDKDMLLKGELKGLKLIQRKLTELVTSLGMKTG